MLKVCLCKRVYFILFEKESFFVVLSCISAIFMLIGRKILE